MPFVLDASVAACWAFQDEDHPTASLALERLRTDEARVPGLWWYEMRNILIVNERRGRLTEAISAAFLHHLASLRVGVDPVPDETGTLALARKHGLSVYDACYLDLARREQLALATLDRQLARAAAAERVTLLGTGEASATEAAAPRSQGRSRRRTPGSPGSAGAR